MSILVIGDPHIQPNNIEEFNIIIPKIINIIKETTPDICIIAGDVLHTHEKINSFALNKAYELIQEISEIISLYILVGNHDFSSNTEFLTTNHWMNALKKWNKVHIIDTVKHISISNHNFILSPYVYPGRFNEALDTIIPTFNWRDADCIFAHQEIKGSKMGAFESEIGDEWSDDLPPIVSGHIHNKQELPNVYYPGSLMQHSFGDTSDNSIILLTFGITTPYDIKHYYLDLPKKKSVYIDITKIDEYKIKETKDHVRLCLSGDTNEFTQFKKSKKFKELTDSGIKVTFKQKKKEITSLEDNNTNSKITKFTDILEKLITEDSIRKIYMDINRN